jgi:phosphomannomutase
MTLIKTISGIRGKIGGNSGSGLGPMETVKFSLAFGRFLQEKNAKPKVIVGRDSRPSGETLSNLVVNSLSVLGVEVIDAGPCSMPTIEMAVLETKADGGIIISASHNPNGWNGLKFLDQNGEILTRAIGEKVLALAEADDYILAAEENFGQIIRDDSFLAMHIDKILALDLVDKEAIAASDFCVAVDGINSVGGRDIPELLHRLGVKKIEKIYCDLSGRFAHNPEPLDINLSGLVELVVEKKCDLGLTVDPDGDRMSVICENGDFFYEEYVLVAVADYFFRKKGPGNTVSNLSSSRALKDVAEKYGGHYFPSAVGETNVVLKMKEVGAPIGGEGNGGVILPELHCGRDGLVGIALFLSLLAQFKGKCSELKKTYPAYFLSKNKLQLPVGIDFAKIFSILEKKYPGEVNRVDGLRIDFGKEWLHLRPSNTEPIMRIYTESYTPAKADALAAEVIKIIKEFTKK